MKSLLIRNSDVMSPDPEGCEHDGPNVTTSHEGDTTVDELRDLLWLMTSKKAQRSHITKESKLQVHCLKYKVCIKVKNQNLRATITKECLKNKGLNFQDDLA